MHLKKRGQASTEYIMIVGVILLILIPIFYYSTQKVNAEIRVNQANDAVMSLTRAVNSVYSLGPGTKRTIEITVPSSVDSTLVSGPLIQMTLRVYGGLSDIHQNAITNVTGYIPTAKGTYHIPLEAQEDGTVRIGSTNDTTAPYVIWTYPNGTLEVQQIILQATTNEASSCRYDTNDVSYTSMANFFDGSELTHLKNLGILSNGTHSYYVRCSDVSGNTMITSELIMFTLIINESNGGLPIVYLEGPSNNTNKNFNLVKFTYNVTSEFASIAFCELKLNGLIQGGGVVEQIVIDSSANENESQSLTTSLSKGNYTWYVNCTDDSGFQNEGQSEKRFLIVNASLDETYINSCDGWCGYNGLTNGACENNIPKCADNCGLPYSSNHDCYAGANISATYCLGGAEADTCCCLV